MVRLDEWQCIGHRGIENANVDAAAYARVQSANIGGRLFHAGNQLLRLLIEAFPRLRWEYALVSAAEERDADFLL